MPNAVPESFSYALSDAWAAGVPVLAAPRGALAERIGAHGGGWLLPERFDAAAVAARDPRSRRRRAGSRRGRGYNRSSRSPTRARIPPLDAMTRSLDAFYARFGIDPAAPGTARRRGRSNPSSRRTSTASLFRVELVRLCDELAQTLAALEDTKRRAEAFETRGARLDRQARSRRRAPCRTSFAASTEERERLAKEADLLRLNQEALERLPSPLRRLLLKLAFNARR